MTTDDYFNDGTGTLGQTSGTDDRAWQKWWRDYAGSKLDHDIARAAFAAGQKHYPAGLMEFLQNVQRILGNYENLILKELAEKAKQLLSEDK